MEHNHGPSCKCNEFKLSQNADNINGLIEFSTLTCLNENIIGSCKSVFRDEEEKYSQLDKARCDSVMNDPEMLFIVRFREEVKLRAINVISDLNNMTKELGVYINEENVSFDLAEEPPMFKFDIDHYTDKGEYEVYTNLQQSKNIRTLVLHFRGDQKQVGVKYIGLKGVGNKNVRDIVHANYEVLATKKNNINFGNIANEKFIDK